MSIDELIEKTEELQEAINMEMQAADGPGGFAGVQWAGEMFDAYEHTQAIAAHLRNAAQLDPQE